MAPTRLSIAGLMLGVVVFAAFAESPASVAPTPTGGIAVAVGVPADLSAQRVRVALRRCDASRPLVSRSAAFEAASLDEIEAFVDTPLRLVSAHRFGLEEWPLPAGCYTVRVEPLDARGRSLRSCTAFETVQIPLSPHRWRRLVVLADCGSSPADLPVVDRELNMPPVVTEMERLAGEGAVGGSVAVCATARDAERDALGLRWTGRDAHGQPVAVPAPFYRQQVDDRLVECVRGAGDSLPQQISTTVTDGTWLPSGAWISHEAQRQRRFGVAAPSRGVKTLRIERLADKSRQLFE